ncbi:Hsp20/alpha crystallin family protein [Acidobacteriota bacterium]
MAKKIRPIIRTVRTEAEINRLAGEVFERNRELIALGEGWVPVVDISESDTDIIVEAELPGVSDKDVHLVLHNNRLEIKGIKKEVLVHSRVKYFRLERECGPFRRYVFLPNVVNPDRTKAILENGVLTIVFKKYRRKKQGEVVLKISNQEEK